MENPKEGQSFKGEKHMKIRVFLVNDEKEFTDDLAKRHPLGQTYASRSMDIIFSGTKRFRLILTCFV